MTGAQEQVREISSGRDADSNRTRRELNKSPTKPLDEGHAPLLRGDAYNPVNPGAKTRGVDINQSQKPAETPKTAERRQERTNSQDGGFLTRIMSMVSGTSSASGGDETPKASREPT